MFADPCPSGRPSLAMSHSGRRLVMPASFAPSAIDYLRILPEIIMVVAGTLIMLIGPLLENRKSGFSILTSIAFIAALAGAVAANNNPGTSFSNMLIVDGFATFFR